MLGIKKKIIFAGKLKSRKKHAKTYTSFGFFNLTYTW